MVNEQRFAVIDDGIVSNIVIALSALEPNWVLCEGANIGDEYIDGKFVKPAADVAAQWAAIRADRNNRLAASDWSQLADSPLTNEQRGDWAEHRQELRDITTQDDPFEVIWPTAPQS
jgi:phosphatidylserine/phosphatidylglycerophosphate/cardiolipin synthase-like enzyme